MEKIPYINAGVLLDRFEKVESETDRKKDFRVLREHDGNLFAKQDQDAINGCLKGENISICLPPLQFL